MTTQSSLEQALHLYADELYQTALLLTLDHERAGRALLRAIRTLAAAPPAPPTMLTLTHALLAALPARPPAAARGLWNPRAAHAPLLAALAHLPADQRLALDRVLRHDDDPDQLGPFFGGDPAQASALLCAALLALSPAVDPALTPALLLGDAATDAGCRATRQRLVLPHAASSDPAVRSHLALCSACRAAEHGWEQLRRAAESALRALLRDVAMPPLLADRLDAALQPQPPQALLRQITRPRLLQIGLPVLVLLLIGLLVLPRAAPPAASIATGASGQQQSRALVQQALHTLYTPGVGAGVWHGQYTIRWNFSSGIYATLIGDLWSTTQPQQARIQLVHSAGGAPYEFALASSQSFWYASTPVYGSTLFGPLYAIYPNQVRLAASSAQQHDLIQARLDAGAWGIAANYLRQAATARELRTWGQQRLTDGSQATVIGFAGTSPLGVVADAPDAPATPITILLTISSASGRLQAVREVSGPVGGEQLGQTTWQLRDESYVTDQATTATVFNLDRAYNGVGTFLALDDRRGSADPVLPNLTAAAIRSPADNIDADASIGAPMLPTALPVGIAHAVTIAPSAFSTATTVYSGPGRMLLVSSHPGPIDETLFSELDQPHHEHIRRNGQQILLMAGSGQRYGMQISQPNNTTSQVFAVGVTRAELLDLAASLKPFTVQDFKRAIPMFRTPQLHDPAAFAALFAALDTQPLARGQARHARIETFLRQGPLVDALADPYHRRYYDQRTPLMTSDLWTRRGDTGQLETASAERNASGVLVTMTVTAAQRYQWFDLVANQTYSMTSSMDVAREPIYEPIWTIINMLGCGGTTLEQRADGTRIVAQRDADWYNASCNRPRYANDLYAQMLTGGTMPDRPPPHRSSNDYQGMKEPDAGPYLLDVANQPLLHRVFIDQAGRAYRYEVRAGDRADSTLLEAVARHDDIVAATQVPATVFAGTLPAALLAMESTHPSSGSPSGQMQLGATSEISLTQVITRMTTPLWYLPPDAQTPLDHVEAVLHPALANPDASDIFAAAMQHGLASRLVYRAPDGDRNGMPQALYVGTASRFAAFLRTQRAWTWSAPLTVLVDGSSVAGWQVTTSDDRTWALLELDGTLIALDTSSVQRQARLGLLRRSGP